MLKKFRLAVTVIVALFMVSALMGVFGIGPDMNLGILERIVMFVMAVIFGMILYVIVYYWYGKDYKCPSCGKRFCLKKEGKEVVGRENVSVLMEVKTRNSAGEVTGSQEQYVPGERTTYQVNYVCKKCGERCHSSFVKDVPKL